MTTTTFTCPDCHRELACGKAVHLCVVRAFGEVHREYVGTFDTDIITCGNNPRQVEDDLDTYVLELCRQGLIDTPMTALEPTEPAPPVDDGELGNWGGFRAAVPDDPDDDSDSAPDNDDGKPILGAVNWNSRSADPDDGPPPPWDTSCKNCGQAHHIQRCPEIWAAMRPIGPVSLRVRRTLAWAA